MTVYGSVHTVKEPLDTAGECHDCVVVLQREPVGPELTGMDVDTIHSAGSIIAVFEVYDT